MSSDLDSRTLVPGDLPRFELDPTSKIPSYFKLEVLGSAVVVPRDMPNTPLDTTTKLPGYAPVTILDSRVAVPKDAHVLEVAPKSAAAIQDLPDVLDPDVLTTGEVVLMAKPVEEGTSAWNAIARTASIGFHVVLLVIIIFEPKVFPTKQTTASEIARENVTDLYAPPPAALKEAPKIPPPPPPKPKSPQIHIDPRLLGDFVPRQPQPSPRPAEPEAAEKPKGDSAPPVQPMLKPNPSIPQPLANNVVRDPQLPVDPSHNGLVLPRLSPGKALQQTMHDALKDGGAASVPFGGSAPAVQAPDMQEPMGGGLEVLTPLQGVDFTSYFQRMLAAVYRNWIAAEPESAKMGERGKVILQFRVMQNGVVPPGEPVMYFSSQKESLDRAAVSAIRESSPFEPLPQAFSGPYIEIRFTFKYNLGRSE